MTREEILAMEAGKEMDALVAEKVMKIDTTQYYMLDLTPYPKAEIRHYSTDIAAAWEVVEKMKLFGLCFDGDDNCWRAVFWYSTNPNDVLAMEEASTAPLAICRAALLAVIGE